MLQERLRPERPLPERVAGKLGGTAISEVELKGLSTLLRCGEPSARREETGANGLLSLADEACYRRAIGIVNR